MLLVILYIKSLALYNIIDNIMVMLLPSDRPYNKEYELQCMHKQLRTRLAEDKSEHQRYKRNMEEQNEIYYFPLLKRMHSQEKRQDRRPAVKHAQTPKERSRNKLSTLAKA